eukprot:10235771-Alexandrium_andersonii.AAC.1
MREKWRRTQPSGGSGTDVVVFPGPAQFQVRTLEAILRVPHGGVRIEADFTTDGHWTACGMHFGHPAM